MAGAEKCVVTGAAGLVGQNLIARLRGEGGPGIVALDKHAGNAAILRGLHPDLRVVECDLAEPGEWERELAGATTLVMLHAQIGGLDPSRFERNNVVATERALAAARRHDVPYVVHVSSSVVRSAAVDLYTESKKAAEQRVIDSGIDHCILRPTLMFGWFDRKHLGWLARFMRRTPLFPVPGNGRFPRQPLYAGDFAAIVASCLARRPHGEIYDISGQETIDYIDLVRAIRRVTGARTPVVRVPFRLFWLLLWTWSRFDDDPPFTTLQLEALVLPELFPRIDWPGIFGVEATPLERALEQTFRDPRYADVVLEF